MTPVDDDELTIDELARRIGMTVRNIRAHQSRGLLPPPQVRGRTGYYGPDHVARLRLIQELQADGFNLELIRRLLDSAGGSSSEVLRFKQALAQPFGDEQPVMMSVAELIAEWGTADPSLLQSALWTQTLLVGSAANTAGSSARGRPRTEPRNALVNQYQTSDGRWIAIAAMSPGL